MKSPQQVACGLLATLVAVQPLAYPLPQLRGLGSFMASNAIEFRWNLLLFLAVILAYSAALLPRTGYCRQIGALGILPPVLLLVGLGECAAEDRFSDEIALWGAPLHLLLAAVLPLVAALAVSANAGVSPLRTKSSPYAGVSLIAAGLAALGLLWNFFQTSLAEGWAWDWIESGPVWALGGVVLRTHLWAKLLIATLPPYLAFLGLSSTALMTSAHHLQSPQNTLYLEFYAFDEFSRSAASTGGFGLGSAPLVAFAIALASYGYASMVMPSTSLKTGPAGWGLGLYLALTCVAPHPSWAVPVTLAVLAGGGWRWLAYSITLHSGLVALLLAGVSLVWWAGVPALTPLNPPRWPNLGRHQGTLVEVDPSTVALLGGGGWLYFGQPSSAASLCGRVHCLSLDELRRKMPSPHKTLSARTKLVSRSSKYPESLLS